MEVLTESLTLKETPIPTKVARLMLVSDILHNSSAPVKNASAFRTKFEATLPDIMESFNDLYRSVTGRITAEALKVNYYTLSLKELQWSLLFKTLAAAAQYKVICYPLSLSLSKGLSSDCQVLPPPQPPTPKACAPAALSHSLVF